MKATPQLIEKLLLVQNYREFIRVVLQESSGQTKRANYAALARKANFSSRAFVSEIVSGRKRITANTLPRFISALKLTGAFEVFFRLLVLQQEKDIPRGNWKDEVIEKKLADIKMKLYEKYLNPSPVNAKHLFLSHHVFAVYAALGSQKTGASLREIIARTHLSEVVIIPVLFKMIEQKAVIFEKERYYTTNINLDFQELGENIGFKQAFMESAKEMARKAELMSLNKSQLFFHSAFSVKKDRVPQMRERLRELILEFMDQEQAEDGDAIQKLTLGLYQ